MRKGMAVCIALLVTLSACSRPAVRAAPVPSPSVSSAEPPSMSPSPLATSSPSVTASPSRKPTPKPKPSTTLKKPVAAAADGASGTATRPPTNDGVPTHGAGTFTAAGGGTDVVGTGTVLVKYRVEVEDGIAWGTEPAWTPASFAAAVDPIIAAPQGWTRSAQSPITDPAQHLTDASWSFQRVSALDYSVRIRLATPDTVDQLCGAVGVHTQGVYSCRYGQTILVNLRRWLRGAPGFTNLSMYRTMVIDHETGHFLGFDHMHCPGTGKLAPVMQTQTIDLEGCQPNPYPYTADGTFVTGPWAPS
jgi:hypothetical protein